jgi:hypothetical protein
MSKKIKLIVGTRPCSASRSMMRLKLVNELRKIVSMNLSDKYWYVPAPIPVSGARLKPFIPIIQNGIWEANNGRTFINNIS